MIDLYGEREREKRFLERLSDKLFMGCKKKEIKKRGRRTYNSLRRVSSPISDGRVP